MADRIELTAEPASLLMSKGETAESVITLRNKGKTVDQFTITIEGLYPDWYKLPVSSVALFPNDQDNVKVVVTLPDTLDQTITRYSFWVKATSQENAADFATVEVIINVGVAPKVAMSLSPAKASGHKVNYTIEVNNPDRKECRVQLKASRPKGRLKFRLQPDDFKVPAGGKVESNLNVKTNWLAWTLGEKPYDFEVTAEQPDGIGAEKLIQNGQLISVPWWGFLTRIRLPWISRPPTIQTFTAKTDNKREYQLIWQVKKAKQVKLDDADVDPKGENLVNPPNLRKYTLTATNKWGTTTKSIEVKPLTVPEARLSDKIKVTITPPQLQTKAGMIPAQATVQVQNLSTIVDKFIVEVEGLDESWYSRSASSIALMPQAIDQVQLNFLPPCKKGVKEGIYTFAIVVRSQSVPGEFASVLGKLEIMRAVDYKIRVHPYRLEGMSKVTSLVTVSNTGVSEAKVAIEATDLDDGCKFKLKPDSLVIGAWNSVDVPLVIQPKRNSIFGAVKRYDITVTVSGEQVNPQTANCEFTHSPFIKSWKPIFRTLKAVIAIAVVVVAVVLVIKWGGGFDALKESPKDWFSNIVSSVEGWFN